MDDPGRSRRVVASIAAAIAITALEAVVATRLWPHDTLPEPPAATSVVMERAAPTPRPTPRATPPPTPTPRPVASVTPAPVQRAAPPAARRAGGTATVVHAPPVPRAATVAGVDHAPGDGTGAGSGNASGDATAGGTGSGGTGAGAVDADAPCGYVDFIPDERPRITGTTSYETIRATVTYPDGHAQSETFPYPWIYTDYMQSDPWSPANVGKKNLVVFAQLPPPGTNTRRYPEVIRYILDHTNPNGSTVLQPCPR